jgi:hypothetical protein
VVFVFEESDMLGEMLVLLVKTGLVVGLDDDTLAAAVDGVLFNAFSRMLETAMSENGGEEAEQEEQEEQAE